MSKTLEEVQRQFENAKYSPRPEDVAKAYKAGVEDGGRGSPWDALRGLALGFACGVVLTLFWGNVWLKW
jgi:hypothetical protein